MTGANRRILLSAPRATEADIKAVTDAMRSGWLAPVGPALSGFEEDMTRYIGVAHAVALASGTSALHLALKYLGVGPGDAVLIPTVTFGATAFPVTYLGAEPVFIDVDASWNIDPELVRSAITELRRVGRRVSAAVPVDLYGTPANFGQLSQVLTDAEVPYVEDAAEALGSTCEGAAAGAQGAAGILSFNGNKLITTSGGGMLITDDSELADKARYWSTQSREALPWYEHHDIGYNYRMSNILAALGQSQLRRVDSEVAKRRQIREWYRSLLEHISGVRVQDDPPWGRSNAWLTVVIFDADRYPDAATRVRGFLEEHDVESRPIWRPMHQQPVFQSNLSFLTGFADGLFRNGLCLPSGSGLDEEEVSRVASLVHQALLTFGR